VEAQRSHAFSALSVTRYSRFSPGPNGCFRCLSRSDALTHFSPFASSELYLFLKAEWTNASRASPLHKWDWMQTLCLKALAIIVGLNKAGFFSVPPFPKKAVVERIFVFTVR